MQHGVQVFLASLFFNKHRHKEILRYKYVHCINICREILNVNEWNESPFLASRVFAPELSDRLVRYEWRQDFPELKINQISSKYSEER